MNEEQRDDFELEWHGDAVVVTPAGSVETMSWDVVEQAADLVLAPLGQRSAPLVVVDLSRVSYFGSVFLALLLRCHKLVRQKGGELVLCGASKLARELLQITNLDTLWAIYDTREEALEAVGA
ncbi:MAG: anti-sigma factor antagonist [Planctomycetota bacterium]|nr:MAG: anti-sigma factor antagonist [Planctomycetota bacterium]REJ87644.1 MAG: anti-sigma factor antagonist [Planctomycetota bacterium]REK23048.1 MAG: anti-sigma factor antagonist [Planctomycetota bacterium]REK34064.1 MAG: anti-sigma factor antagonist [Planctomycetota bacterium]